jgi:hypothetical protein
LALTTPVKKRILRERILLFTAFGTIGAVIVALFKDDISKWRNKVKLEISSNFCLKEETFEADDKRNYKNM